MYLVYKEPYYLIIREGIALMVINLRWQVVVVGRVGIDARSS